MWNSRRNFIGSSVLGIFGVIPVTRQFDFLKRNNTESHGLMNSNKDGVNPLFPTQDPDDVRQVVGAAHTKLDVVKELVTARPELAKATYDWGFGDWESALGAASHMGRKDIAEFLIEYGARPDIYTFAMLGRLDTVKSMIEDMPGIQKIRGPHGFTLMHHARMRLRRENVEGVEKEEQEALVAYLESLGDADIKADALDITPEEQKVYLGKYSFGDGVDEFLNVTINSRGGLFLARGEYFGRALLRVDTHAFAPGGTPSVRIKFDVTDGLAQAVTVHDPVPIVKATRIEI